MKLRLVAATELPEALFWEATYLGRSLRRIPESLRPQTMFAFGNTGKKLRGLSEVFNLALDRTDADTNIVFVHDDVYLHDWFLSERLAEAFERFDVVGLAGSSNPDLSQPSWGLCFDQNLNASGWQPGVQRSGAINHFDYACPTVSIYGPTPQPCVLLDGVFLAVRTAALQERQVRFDPRFAFHCYDIDFCRTASEKGLRLGTWPIAITHDSGGAYGSDAFKRAARAYLDKWARGSDAAASSQSDMATAAASENRLGASLPRD
jgi:GT2 family glycosyltransferase